MYIPNYHTSVLPCFIALPLANLHPGHHHISRRLPLKDANLHLGKLYSDLFWGFEIEILLLVL